MNNRDFTNATVGETVILYTGYNAIIAKIKRITKTQIHAEGKGYGGSVWGGAFQAKTGYEVGHGEMSIHYPAPGEIQELNDDYERNTLGRELDNISWRNLPLTTLRIVKSALNSATVEGSK